MLQVDGAPPVTTLSDRSQGAEPIWGPVPRSGDFDKGAMWLSTGMERSMWRAAVRVAALTTRINTSADYHVEYAPAALAA